ncbi:hypothetical protein [Mesorhizobium sp. ANAO-SY3R2]|uniref:hypothetical protein n=1 Tax=Mesorhizobium sp. ANAO-SY3R2 TaxID=3166644 RepID=UPI00366F69AC
MDTQPRAEDEVLSQHETQAEEHVATDEAVAGPVVLTAADEVTVPSESLATEASAADESAIEAEEDIELSAEDLQDEWQVAPEAAEAKPESPEMEAQDQAIEDWGLVEPVSVELAPEELDFEEFLNEELAAEEFAPPVEVEASDEVVEMLAAETPAVATKFVTESEFEQLVDEALESVGGILLFKMRIDDDGEDKHIAAASIGDGARRQFLLLSLPVVGGKLKVESASRSKSPLAKLAEAYVGVVEAFRSAA